MQEFVMTVGLPASGKTVFSKKLEQQGYVWLSSDAIRSELYHSEEEQKDPARVFQLMNERTVAALHAGSSVVYDATNMSRKHRMALLQLIHNTAAAKRCVIFAVPVEECRRRNEQRSRVVPESAYTMLHRFECPYYFEGWDSIEVNAWENRWRYPIEEAEELSQDNPHHSLTLGGHLRAAEAYAKEHGGSARVITAAACHDWGKLQTKTFYNKKGVRSPIAHFYEHENVGAYLYLLDRCCGPEGITSGEAWLDTLYIANLINLHMRPLNAWGHSEKSKNKDREMLGEAMFADLCLVHDADMAAH